MLNKEDKGMGSFSVEACRLEEDSHCKLNIKTSTSFKTFRTSIHFGWKRCATWYSRPWVLAIRHRQAWSQIDVQTGGDLHGSHNF